MKLRSKLILLSVLYSFWTVAPASAQDWVYRAQLGDTLWDLCLEYTAKQGCWMELGRYNNISQDRRIAPGTEIRIPLDWLVHVPIAGKVLNVNGDVSYRSRKDATPQPLSSGQDIALGSVLVSRSGTARIRLGKDSELLLRPNSILEIAETGTAASPSSRVYLEDGEVEVKVNPASRSRFEVHTPSAIAAVRGTEYRVASLREESSTRGEVLEGVVAVEAGSIVEVPTGFGVKATAGKPLGKPRKLLAAPRFEAGRIDAPLPITLRWQSDPQAVSWQVDVYDAGESGTLLYSAVAPEPFLTLDSLDEGCYRVIARAVDNAGFNGLEEELPVCVLPPPPIVEEPPNYWGLAPWFATLILILLL